MRFTGALSTRLRLVSNRVRLVCIGCDFYLLRGAVVTVAKALMTSVRPDWRTPANVLELVRQVGPIGLDPCSGPGSIVGAKTEWSLENGDDGLANSWAGHGLVYVNCPYGREIVQWVDKCDREGSGIDCEIIALLPARTDAKWFQRLWYAQALCFWKGRIRFLGAPASAPFPSVIAYWGPHWNRFARVFGDSGRVIYT